MDYFKNHHAAETGSGKTGAFSLPLTQIVWEIRRDELENMTQCKKNSGNYYHVIVKMLYISVKPSWQHKLWLKSHKFKGPLLDSFCIIHQQKRIQESTIMKLKSLEMAYVVGTLNLGLLLNYFVVEIFIISFNIRN
uniref:DEAD domain-containing protein n=1 Tax=Heterorhabditis bacteriophora TaxID=37862 RepID=A0A1I7WC28_HETBA